jgi:two-component system cell cycle response regulator DivK
MTLIEKVLSQAGHITFTATTAETGVVLARALLPELIIMDVQLPGMDGLAAARRLKDQTQTRYIPLVALTLPIRGAEERILAAGCDGYLVKPLHGEKLLNEIKRQIRRHNIVE